MEGILKVTPEKLLEASERFAASEQTIRSITAEMNSIVDGFKSVWQGEAASGFANRYASLNDDMEKMYGMIREHSQDLSEMARAYQQAEDESVNEASALVTEAIV